MLLKYINAINHHHLVIQKECFNLGEKRKVIKEETFFFFIEKLKD